MIFWASIFFTLVVSIPSLSLSAEDVATPAKIESFYSVVVIGETAKPVTIWYYAPSLASAYSPVLFIMHGMERKPRLYLEPWVPYAKREGVYLVAPEFSREHFAGSRNYNLGGIRPGRAAESPPGETTYGAIEKIFDEFVKATGSRSKTYWIYGHSAGAQFVHRMILLTPAIRLNLAIAANAGWYTIPSFQQTFPYGLSGSGATVDGLRHALKKKLIVFLGEEDRDPQHPSLNRSQGAMKQGEHRFARGETFYQTAKIEAERLGAEFGWELKTVHGAGHDNAAMARAAAALLR